MKKRVLAAVLLAGALMVAPAGSGLVATVSATGNNTVESSSSGGTTVRTSATARSIAHSRVTSEDGSVITSTVGGTYSIYTMSGAAITTPYSQVAAALGAPSGASVRVRMEDSECGPMAQKSIDDGIKQLADAGITATEAAALDIYAYVNKQSVVSVTTPVRIQAGLPKSMQDGSQVAVILVQEGGTVTVLRDQDTDPATITIDTPGFGVFAFVKIK